MKKAAIILLVLDFLLIGCRNDGPLSNSGASATQVGESSTERVTKDATVPAPDEDSGVIVGQLVHEVSGIGIGRQLIYLGEYLPLTPGPGEMIAMQVESSISTETDEDGYFVFEGVKPGTYPLIVWNPLTSKVVPDESGEAALDVVVRAGEITDLNVISIIWP
jgi:hypothetical protein